MMNKNIKRRLTDHPCHRCKKNVSVKEFIKIIRPELPLLAGVFVVVVFHAVVLGDVLSKINLL